MEYVLSFFGLPHTDAQKVDNFISRLFFHISDHFIPHHRNNYHPHLLGHKSLGLLSALLVSVKIFSIALVSFGPVVEVFSSAITPQNIITLTNASRASSGLSALVENNLLAVAAQAKAEDMLSKGYFSHNTPDGKTPWDFIKASGYSYISAGENLAVNFVEAEDVEAAWMNSPGHKANIMNQQFEEIGIGIAQGTYEGHNAIFVVQMFGTPVAQSVAIDDKPTAVAPAAVVINQEVQTIPVVVETVKTEQNETVTLAQTDVIKNQINQIKQLEITQTSFNQNGSSIEVMAEVAGDPVKVMAKFGNSAVMLSPKSDGSWVGAVDLSQVSNEGNGLVLQAEDIKGQSVQTVLGSFAGSTQDNFKVAVDTNTKQPKVNFLGRIFNVKNFQNNFYLIFAASLLTCLIIAIAIKRHVQHLPLIANTALVIVLAIGLWVR